MRNVLDRLPQREQSEAKDLLRAVVYAPSRAEAVKAREVFARRYRPWYPKAVDVLEDDWERMVAFYDFPEDHWKHLHCLVVHDLLERGKQRIFGSNLLMSLHAFPDTCGFHAFGSCQQNRTPADHAIHAAHVLCNGQLRIVVHRHEAQGLVHRVVPVHRYRLPLSGGQHPYTQHRVSDECFRGPRARRVPVHIFQVLRVMIATGLGKGILVIAEQKRQLPIDIRREMSNFHRRCRRRLGISLFEGFPSAIGKSRAPRINTKPQQTSL